MERDIHSNTARLILQTELGYGVWGGVTPGVNAILFTVDNHFEARGAEELEHADFLICPFFRTTDGRPELAVNVARCSRGESSWDDTVEFTIEDNGDGTFSLFPSEYQQLVNWCGVANPYADQTLTQKEVDELVEQALTLNESGLCPN